MCEEYFFMISKVKNTKYLQIWFGENTNKRKFIKSVGTAEKLVKDLERLKRYDDLTKKYPGILTKLSEEEKQEYN